MTVHGEREKIPALSKAEAGKALKQFVAGYNEANTAKDPAATATYETGPLRDIDQAVIKVERRKGVGFGPLELSDAKFVIPKMAGWPKFFVADALSNRKNTRWTLAFTRNGPQEKWKAAYLLTLPKNRTPEFATDKDGYAEAVPAGKGSGGLTIDPAKLSSTYATYLKAGEGDTFAPGPATDGLRRDRAAEADGLGRHIDTVDQPYKFPAMALRTKDGGALAFFGTRYYQRKTLSAGSTIAYTPETEALLQGQKKKTNKMTYTTVSEQAVKVPAEDAGGRVAFLSRLEQKTAAKAE
ncbi:hypothetical protein [Streptomyces niger]|uniref:hypothetical protein n=1 Tax=Streptomyces niger TaxID=66373 RepID=UPI0006995CA7|nr:hypothetical protein [Streptomyces niger]